MLPNDYHLVTVPLRCISFCVIVPNSIDSQSISQSMNLQVFLPFCHSRCLSSSFLLSFWSFACCLCSALLSERLHCCKAVMESFPSVWDSCRASLLSSSTLCPCLSLPLLLSVCLCVPCSAIS